MLAFDESDQQNIICLLAVCLHLGNIEFESMTVDNMDASEITNVRVVRDVCKLLQADQESLSNALTSRSTYTRGEMIITRISGDSAADVRDAFVKAIYGRVFIWIVSKINLAIYKPQVTEGGRVPIRRSIGVLDIFGFENFAVNRSVDLNCLEEEEIYYQLTILSFSRTISVGLHLQL